MNEGSWVGLDVHARTTLASVLDAASGELRVQRVSPRSEETVAWLQRLPQPVRVAYEAGPTGYGLARACAEAGIACTVAAPSKIPRAPGGSGQDRPPRRRALGTALAIGRAGCRAGARSARGSGTRPRACPRGRTLRSHACPPPPFEAASTTRARVRGLGLDARPRGLASPTALSQPAARARLRRVLRRRHAGKGTPRLP